MASRWKVKESIVGIAAVFGFFLGLGIGLQVGAAQLLGALGAALGGGIGWWIARRK